MSPSQQRHLYEYVYNTNTQRKNFDALEKKLIAYVFLMFSNIFFNDSLSKNNADFFLFFPAYQLCLKITVSLLI